MPRSDNDREPDSAIAGQSLAVTAEILYLANLLVAPGLAFFILLALYLRRGKEAPPLASCHLRQTVSASLWAAALLILVNAVILLTGGYHQTSTWVIVLLYFAVCHSTLVLLGIVGLAKAMAGKPFIYPLLGRHCDE